MTATSDSRRPLRLRHYFTHFHSLGGVQSILRTHLRLDSSAGFESSLLAFFDPSLSEVDSLGLNGLNTIRSTRPRFAAHERDQEFDIPIYHDLWGLAFLGEFDRSPLRRIGAVHSQWPHLDQQLAQLRGSLDGVFCDSQAIADRVLEQMPELEPQRVRHLPVPTQIAPEPFIEGRRSGLSSKLVLGFVGRLDYAQKRVERFPALTQVLQSEGIDFELHFLGSGDASKSLPARFPSGAPVLFHGRKSGADYWEIMSKWDFVIYTSDHEGSPLAMIEALSVGNLPLFPDIGSGGDLIARSIDSQLVYPPGDFHSVAARLKHWQTRSASDIDEARTRCRDVSLNHSPESYHSQFSDLLRFVTKAPRVSKDFLPQRPFFLTDHLPFGLLKRALPQGFFNSNPLSNDPPSRAWNKGS